MSDTIKLRLWEVRTTDAAHLFSTTPRQPHRDGHQAWLPRSQINHISRQPVTGEDWQECEVTIPEWLADRKGLL